METPNARPTNARPPAATPAEVRRTLQEEHAQARAARRARAERDARRSLQDAREELEETLARIPGGYRVRVRSNLRRAR